MCCYRYNNNTVVYNVIYLPLTCQFLTHANSRARSFLLLPEGGGGRGDCGGEQKREQMHYHTEAKQDFPECSALFHQARSERFKKY